MHLGKAICIIVPCSGNSCSGLLLMTATKSLYNGRQFPAIGLGAYAMPLSQTTAIVEKALALGYRLVDTANEYMNEKQCAEGVAAFLKKHPNVPRDDVWYASKMWQSDFGYESGKRAIAAALNEAKSLGRIDLYIMHSPAGGQKTRLDTWKALQEAVQAGHIREIGVSNWSVKHLQELLEWPELKVRPAVNQIELSPWMHHQDIVDFCNDNDIVVEAYSPLVLGKKMKDPQLLKLAEKYEKSPAQILLRWSVQQGAVPIPKSSNEQRLKENLDIFDFELTPSDFKSLGDPKSYLVTVWDPTTWS